MQKSKSNSFVIFPSSVRTIPFTVPGVPSSYSCNCSTRSSHLSIDELSSCPRCSSPCSLRSTEVSSFCRKNNTIPGTSTGLSATLGSSPSMGRKVGTSQRWASVECFSSIQGRLERNVLDNASLRRSQYKLSCDSIASKATIDLEHANSLFGIDPSLYLSTESGLEEASIGDGGPEREDDEDDLDTGVYDESNIGRVWFALEYDPESERLLVSLLHIRNLPTSFVSNPNARDPIIRSWLMPDERRWVQAKFKRKTRNPRINEHFTFQVSARDFAERSIKLTVFGSGDRHNRRQSALGHVIYPLKDHICEANERIVICRDLEKDATISEQKNEDVQLYMSLSYNSELSRLSISIHSGKNFPPSEDGNPHSNEFYVIVSQMEMSKVVKKKKTSVVKRIINFSPIFNELFHFKVRPDNLDIASFLVSVMRHLSGRKDTPIGRLVIGSFMFARGSELDHWNAMLVNEKEQVPKWHTLTV